MFFRGAGGRCFEHEANRPSAQTSPASLGKCYCNETSMCDHYSCIFYLIPTIFTLKLLFKL